ncbi:phage tail tape measure protein [Aureimonas sp. AU40]|uniref:phage tail tape measure protein n=1 Tax=Aureimonas sp. AU40 TaxID=1637747 RepID=UPI00244EF82A|nr:phage tail tape measure protein [Aureimonas sp. AU40]
MARVIAPLAGAFSAQQIIASAADFESSMTGIQKKAGTTAEQTKALGEEIKALAASGELAVPIEEILGAYERGAAAGIPIAELKEFARLSVKAADAFEMPAEEVGNFASKLKTSMGLSETAIKRVFDLTNSLADSGISDEKDIVNFVDRSAASLKTLGLTMDQTLSLGSTLLNLGMPAEVASTAMEALSTKMLTATTLTGESRKTFEKYMGPVKKFSKAVKKDANGALLQMLDRLQALNSEQRMDFLSSFVGQEHAGKILRLAEAADEYRRNLALAADEAKWTNSLDTAYKLKLDDFWSQWQLVKNAFRNLTIDAGSMGLPALTDGLSGIKTLIAEIGQGLKTLEAKVDWTDIDRAKAAVVDLGGSIADLLQMDTSKSPIGDFFSDIAKGINEVSRATKYVSDELKDVADFIKDPVGFMNDPARRQASGERNGFKAWTPEEKAEAIRQHQAAEQQQVTDREARSRSANPLEAVQARTEIGALGGTLPPSPQQRRPDPVRRAIGAAETVGEEQANLNQATGLRRSYFGKRLATAKAELADLSAGLPEAARASLDAYAAAVAAGGGQVTDQARLIGENIRSALSVTATPQVDTSGIDAAQLKVDQLHRSLTALPGAVEGAALNARRAAEDYEDVNADIGN